MGQMRVIVIMGAGDMGMMVKRGMVEAGVWAAEVWRSDVGAFASWIG